MSQNQIKIESIKKLKRPGFYSLITSEETISITDDIIVKYALTKDLVLTKEEFEKLKKDNEKNNFYLKACHYIYYQMRSLREVEEYLRKYQINEDYLNEIIERLKSLQLVDDNMLCTLILESTINSLKGPNAFINKVKQRKLIVNLNNFIYSRDIEEEVIDKVIQKNISKKENLPIRKQKEQLYAKLIRDGFSLDLINSKINKIDFKDNSNKTLENEINKLLKKYLELDEKTKYSKIFASLIRKGYSYSQINSKINSIDNIE